mgnify:CR=1 FL=1
MGPCRISPFEDEGPQRAICGATADIIVARNLIRMIAGGAAAHSDHGRDLAHTLLLTAEGKSGGYDIKDEIKLAALAGEYGKHDLVYSGPLYKTHKVEGNTVRIAFDHRGVILDRCLWIVRVLDVVRLGG